MMGLTARVGVGVLARRLPLGRQWLIVFVTSEHIKMGLALYPQQRLTPQPYLPV